MKRKKKKPNPKRILDKWSERVVKASVLAQSVRRTILMYETMFSYCRTESEKENFVFSDPVLTLILENQEGFCAGQGQLIGEALDDLRAVMSSDAFRLLESEGAKMITLHIEGNRTQLANRALHMFDYAAGTKTEGEDCSPSRMITSLIRAAGAQFEDGEYSIPDRDSDRGKAKRVMFAFARDALMAVLALFAFDYATEMLRAQMQKSMPDDRGKPLYIPLPSAPRQEPVSPLVLALQRGMKSSFGHEDLPPGAGPLNRSSSAPERRERFAVTPDKEVGTLLRKIYAAVLKLKGIYGSPKLELPEFPGRCQDV